MSLLGRRRSKHSASPPNLKFGNNANTGPIIQSGNNTYISTDPAETRSPAVKLGLAAVGAVFAMVGTVVAVSWLVPALESWIYGSSPVNELSGWGWALSLFGILFFGGMLLGLFQRAFHSPSTFERFMMIGVWTLGVSSLIATMFEGLATDETLGMAPIVVPWSMMIVAVLWLLRI